MENNVSFMNADLDGSRSDAAGITIKNWKPEIVYGLNSDIKLTPSQEQQLKLIWLDQWWSWLKLNIK